VEIKDSPGGRSAIPSDLYLGTSSWSSKDWNGVFYPAGMPPSDYLSHYATRFRTVEVDATFYRIPSDSMTRKWRRDLPEGFLLAAKVPQVITHEKILVDCDGDLRDFLASMDNLGDRLGPLLFQFPYYRRDDGITEEGFLQRLREFLPALPSGYRFALEIRNKWWLKPPFFDLLRAHNVAFAIIDHPWMPAAAQYLNGMDPVTADFGYVRWLGDRYAIEARTRTWDKVIIDRAGETRGWVTVVRKLLERVKPVFGFYNNHYAGHAPASIELFEKIWGGLEPVRPDDAPAGLFG
jgi:uncharacterized protein YecE (DUF72 family)